MFVDRDRRVRIPVVPQRVQRPLAGGEHHLAIEGKILEELEVLGQRLLLAGIEHVEAPKVYRADNGRLPFVDANGDIDLVLGGIQLDVERGDAGVRIPEIPVERLDTPEIGVERPTVEVGLTSPRQAGAAPGLQSRRQRAGLDARHPFELQAVNGDVPLVPASRKGDDSKKAEKR
jgi:hypothetical protein